MKKTFPKKYKVCMVMHQYYFGDARVMGYAEALERAGVQVDVLCTQGQVEGHSENVRVISIPLGHRRRNPVGYLFEYIMSLILFSIWLLVLFVRNRYQVIHVNNLPDFLIITGLIPKIFGAKLILDIHDPMPELFMAKYNKPSANLLVKIIQIQERLSSKLANVIITVNKECKNNLASRGIPANKIFIIRNFPDPTVFDRNRYDRKANLQSQVYTLICPGTIAPRYGLDVAIRALPQLVKRIPNIRYTIIGKWTSYATELLNIAKQLGVSPNVQILPPIPRDQVPQTLVLADVGIYTACSSPHMDIAIPGKMLEYALMGIPIIASRLHVLEDWFDKSSVLFFESGNIQQFADCVLELYENPDLAQQLVQNMDRTFVSTHHWEDEKREYFNVLRRLLPQGLIPQGDDQCP